MTEPIWVLPQPRTYLNASARAQIAIGYGGLAAVPGLRADPFRAPSYIFTESKSIRLRKSKKLSPVTASLHSIINTTIQKDYSHINIQKSLYFSKEIISPLTINKFNLSKNETRNVGTIKTGIFNKSNFYITTDITEIVELIPIPSTLIKNIYFLNDIKILWGENHLRLIKEDDKLRGVYIEI